MEKNSPSLEAECAVIGSMLIDSETIAPTIARATEEDFMHPAYRELFRAIRAIFARKAPVDGVTVNAETGGIHHDLILQIMELTPTSANCAVYVDLLKEQAQLYRMQRLGNLLAASSDLEECRKLLDQANRSMVYRNGIQSMNMEQAFNRFLDRHSSEKRTDFLPWGMGFLDSLVMVESGDMVVLGGYPSDGKTALALMFAFKIAGTGKRVQFFTNEGTLDKLTDRIIAAQCLLNLGKIRKNELTEADFGEILDMRDHLVKPALEITMAVDWTVFDIQSYSQARHADVVFVDYMQNIPAEHGSSRMTDFERVSTVSHGLQKYGRGTGTTIVALSQLTRPEKRKDGTVPAPTMASLRQSGQIEMDADVIMLLYSEFPDRSDSPRVLKLAKNKDGERNHATRLAFDGDKQHFTVRSELPDPSVESRPKSMQVKIEEIKEKLERDQVNRIFPPDGEAEQ